ncbi:putative vascular cell adhesion protein 1 [Triplophysa rosa]|uniref:Vascular cell adhesion protein 1 n=1 Tax=Triplophysa rosa TaxID=992332 RepID=A0A9W7TVL4_TRIRA|nr:putative vascular cell adhesion protein 1 [Triplophysa rosa]
MLQSFFGLFCISAFCLLVSLTGTNAECPLEFNPQRVVVRYGGSVSVDCSTNITHKGIGWEASEGPVPTNRDQNLITWRVSSLRQWDIKPICYINYDGPQCEKNLPITIYKTPDSVSINTADHTGPMIYFSTYKLQCDVVNVAPVQNLIVKWYKGETLMHNETFIYFIMTPVNTTSILQIIADRSDDGVQYRCEAELELGAEGPQPPPAVTSEPIQMTVVYPPQHISLVETIEKIDGEVSLNCTVAANPTATYTWHSEHLKETRSSSVLSSSTLSPGNYTCTAKNLLGDSSKVFIINSAVASIFYKINFPQNWFYTINVVHSNNQTNINHRQAIL